MEKLHIYLKGGEEFQYPLIPDKISVGRSTVNDIHLPDMYCSSHHAFLFAPGDGYVIRDNNSKNGTFLNGN